MQKLITYHTGTPPINATYIYIDTDTIDSILYILVSYTYIHFPCLVLHNKNLILISDSNEGCMDILQIPLLFMLKSSLQSQRDTSLARKAANRLVCHILSSSQY